MPAVLLVRHGRAGKRQQWEGDDRLRPLSVRGRAQADGLVPIIIKLLGREAGRAALLSSAWMRCHQTLGPVSARMGTPVTEVPELGEGMGERGGKFVAGMANTTAVCCTHGDVIGDILTRMRDDGLDLGPAPVWPKGSIWVLQSRQGRFRAARYVAPPT